MKPTQQNPSEHAASKSQQLEGAGLGFLVGFAALLIFQLLGEIAVRVIELPVPGPVIGLILLLIFLLIRKRTNAAEPESLFNASSVLLTHLSLLFVPAGVGIITHFDRIKDQWMPITVALIVASVVTLFVTAWSLKVLIRLMNRPEPE